MRHAKDPEGGNAFGVFSFLEESRAMLEISTEAAVALLAVVAGFSGWMTRQTFLLGSIKASLEHDVKKNTERIADHDFLLKQHRVEIDDHSSRIRKIETAADR